MSRLIFRKNAGILSTVTARRLHIQRSNKEWLLQNRGRNLLPFGGHVRTIESLIGRLRAEYLEMPDLCLTVDQVQRLCGIERTICQLLLDSLVGTKFLRVSSDGRYVLERGGRVARVSRGSIGQAAGRRLAAAS